MVVVGVVCGVVIGAARGGGGAGEQEQKSITLIGGAGP